MWKCPICSNEEKRKYKCGKCGYDKREDFIAFRTLCEVPAEKIQKRKGLAKSKWIETYEDGSWYEGEFLNGERHGQGVYTFANGDRYEGEHKKGKFHGKGIYYYRSGDRYEGGYADGVRQGKGTYYYSNGDRYEGKYADGVRQGKGTYYYSSGDRYEGEFANGVRQGKWAYYYSNGNRYEGEYVNDNCQGKVIFYDANGTKQEGKLKDGKFVKDSLWKSMIKKKWKSIRNLSSQEYMAEENNEIKEVSWALLATEKCEVPMEYNELMEDNLIRKGAAHNVVRKLSDEEMKQEITNILFDSRNIGKTNADLCQNLAARGVDHSRFKRAVTQMVIRGQAEYRSNKLYLNETGLQTRGNVVNSVKTIISTPGSIQKDSEEAVRNEVIRLLRLNKNTGLNNAQIKSELGKNGFPTKRFDRIRTRLVIDRIAEYHENRLFIIR